MGLNESLFEIRAAGLGEQQWSACASYLFGLATVIVATGLAVNA